MSEFLLEKILAELVKREPIFHRPEFGTTRHDFEKMIDLEFFEIGASGHQYSRAFILDTLEQRHAAGEIQEVWETFDFDCKEIALNNYLLTYTLVQEGRITRRTTIWRKAGQEWRILFHQGTVVEGE